MHESAKTQAILQRMKEVRRDLDEDVQEIVEGARDMGAWRSYVKSYPWICVGAALAAGYLIVPRRLRAMPPEVQTPAETPSPSSLVTSYSPPKGNAPGMLLAFVGNLVKQGVATYVGQQAGKLLTAQADNSPQDEQP